MKIQCIKEQYWNIGAAFSTKIVKSNNMNFYEDQSIKWRPSPTEWCTLNVDGCVKLHDQIASGGGLIRNEFVEWIKDFIHNTGTCTNEEAELWVVCKGLEMT